MAKISITPEEKLEAVKAHAYANYEKGWDLVVETKTDEEILDMCKKASTGFGCILAVRHHMDAVIDWHNEQMSIRSAMLKGEW